MSFEPKQKVELDPPKDDVISEDYLSKCDGEFFARPQRRPLTESTRLDSRLPHICCDKSIIPSMTKSLVQEADSCKGDRIRREWQQGLRTGGLVQRYR